MGAAGVRRRYLDVGIHVGLPLVLGGIVYLFFRRSSILLDRWVPAMGLAPFVGRIHLIAQHIRLPQWCVYSAPDGLWVYSLTYSLGRTWLFASRWQRITWTAVGPFVGIGGELGQLVGIVPGTFDIPDLFCITIASIAAVLFLRLKGANYES